MGTRRRALQLGLGAFAAALLPGCGGGGDDDQAYRLAIDGEPTRSTSQSETLLTGQGFLPPGSTCPSGCSGLLPPPVFGRLGPYTLVWRNESSGRSGRMTLGWICNCGGSAPAWMANVPLVAGANRIVVSMSAGGIRQSVAVTVTRA